MLVISIINFYTYLLFIPRYRTLHLNAFCTNLYTSLYQDGFMFWSDWGDDPMIERANMDGHDRITISSKKLIYPNGLAIDYEKSKIYFVDGGTKTLEYMNFDGSGRQVILST